MTKSSLRYFGFALLAMAALTGPVVAAPSLEELQAHLDKLPAEGKEKLKARLHSDIATILYKQGKPVEAAEEFELALTFDTDHGLRRHIYRFLGKSYESSNRIDKAISAYEQAVQADPKNWRRHRDLASLYEQVELYEKAVESYQTTLKLNPSDPDIEFSLGRTLRKSVLYEKALTHLERAQQLGIDAPVVLKELSFLYEGQGRYQEAADAYLQQMEPASSAADNARLVYLAVLARNQTMARQGMDRLKRSSDDKQTVQFYENLVELAHSTPEDLLSRYPKDRTFNSLVEALDYP